MSEAATTAAGIALYPSGGAAAVSNSVTVGGAVQIVTLFGVSLGLRPDLLIAGMFGALVSIFLLNSVPMQGEGIAARLGNMVQRFFVVVSSAVTSGYLVPLIASVAPAMNQEWLLGSAFVVGASAQRMLQLFISRYADAVHTPRSRQRASKTNPANEG